MNQLQVRIGNYINSKENMRKLSNPQPENEKQSDQSYDARDKFQRAEKTDDSTPKTFVAKFTEYARLNASRSQILIDIERDKDFKCPMPIKSEPEKRNQNLYCRFHKDLGSWYSFVNQTSALSVNTKEHDYCFCKKGDWLSTY